MAPQTQTPSTTFDPDEFMKSRGTAPVEFDPDTFMQQRQAATPAPAAAPAAPAAPPESTGKKLWHKVQTGEVTPLNAISKGAEAVGNWAGGKANEAEQADLVNAAAGKPRQGLTDFTPAKGYDLLARGAHTISGATSPGAAALTAATIAAPEVVAPAVIAHGGLGTIEGLWDTYKKGWNPETSEKTLGSASELAGGLAVGAHAIGAGPGPITEAIKDRNPVARGTQAYQKTIAPSTSKAIEQLDDTETIKRAMPYLSEQEKLTPVQAKQTSGPQAGQRLGVMNYRQNALTAADRLWNEKITPVTEPYNNAPIDHGRVALEIRNTLDPNAPPNEGKVNAVHDLADHYNQPTTVKEALKKVKALNGDKQVAAYENALPDQQAAMLNADPAIEAKVKAVNILRDAVFDSIERHGSPAEANYVREARKDFGSLMQVSKNLGASNVPTPGSFTEKFINTAKALVRPRTAPVETLFSDPNKLAAKSSRLFGVADVATRPQPTPRATPWAPPQPSPFIVPPGAPQAPPNAAGSVEGIGSVTGSSPGTRGTAGTRIHGLLPESIAQPSTTPPNAAGAVEATGTVQNPEAVGARGIAGTRFGPKALLPGPVWGEPVPNVGGPPPPGFPARMGLWEGLPNPNAAGPGFEPLPKTPVTVSPQETGVTGRAPGPITPLDLPSQRLDVPKLKPTKAGQGKLDLTSKGPKNVPHGTATAEAAPNVKVTTDSMGIRWAENPNGVRVSVPKSVADADVEAYARPKLEEQEASQKALGNRIGTTPVKMTAPAKVGPPTNGGRNLADVFNSEPGPEVEAAKKFESERQANKAARIKDIANITEQAFNEPAAKAATIEKPKATTRINQGENLVGAQHKSMTLHDPAGKEIGTAMLSDVDEGGKKGLEVSVAEIAAEHRGKGFGKQMYKDIIQHARENGYDRVVSDKNRTQDANRVWESLKRSGAPVKLENGRYTIDLAEERRAEMRNPEHGTAEERPQLKFKGGINEKGVEASLRPGSAEDKAAALGAETNDLRQRMRRASLSEEDRKTLQERIRQNDEAVKSLKENGTLPGAKEPEGVLPGMGEHVAKQNEGAARVKSEDLTREANTPKNIDAAAGEMERKSPLFRGTAASPQGELLSPAQKASSIEEAKPEVSKPFHEQYTPEEITDAEGLLRSEVGVTGAGERPGRYFDEAPFGEANPQRIQRSDKGIASGGEWRGVRSGRNMLTFLKAYPEFTPSMIENALKRPDSPSYQRMVAKAIKLIRDQNLSPEERQTAHEARRQDPNRPADALDLIEGLKNFRKPKT